jgi:flagellar biosynthetic protein FlhB
VGMLAAGVSVLALGTPAAFVALRDLMAGVFVEATQVKLDAATLPAVVTDLGFRVVLLLLPFFGVLMVAAVALNLMQSGFGLSTKALQPKPDRISPLSGLKRIFSSQGAFTLLKSLVKIALVAPIAYFSIKKHLPEIMVLHTFPLQAILTQTASWILSMLLQMLVVLALVSGADFGYEKWRHKKNLKMSFQEVKDEAKDQEGNPQVKGKRREIARKLARGIRLDHAVMKADVVVTNPTHFAVALRYDPVEADAPRVIVKGIRKRALRIKELARQFGIPTVEDRPLARALYNSVEEEQTIPEELFPAVAALLAEIYRQRGRQGPNG